MADLSDLQSKLLELEENYICSGSTEPFVLVFDPNSCEEIEAVDLSSLVTNAEIYVDGGSTNDGNLVLTDNDAGTPDVVIDICPAIEFCIENNNFDLFQINGNTIESGDDITVQNDLGYNPTTQAIEQGFPLTRDTNTDLSGFTRTWTGEAPKLEIANTTEDEGGIRMYDTGGPTNNFAEILYDSNGSGPLAGALNFYVNSNQAKLTILPTGETVVKSGTADYSGLVLEELDGTSPQITIDQATPLGYRNSDGLVVPIQRYKELFINATTIDRPFPTTVAISQDTVDIGEITRTNTTGVDAYIYVEGRVESNRDVVGPEIYFTEGIEFSSFSGLTDITTFNGRDGATYNFSANPVFGNNFSRSYSIRVGGIVQAGQTAIVRMRTYGQYSGGLDNATTNGLIFPRLNAKIGYYG